MVEHHYDKLISAVFITFSGNCKKALTFYQTCFGGLLQFELFEKELPGYPEMPVVNGSLVSDRIVIHGSDLIHNEGRKLGNYMAIFLHCKNTAERKTLIEKLEAN
ncbi:MAG: glyoxalase, partial [Bacteroidota bacterium]